MRRGFLLAGLLIRSGLLVYELVVIVKFRLFRFWVPNSIKMG